MTHSMKNGMKINDGGFYLRMVMFMVSRSVVEATRVVGFLQMLLTVHIVGVFKVGCKLWLFQSRNVMHS